MTYSNKPKPIPKGIRRNLLRNRFSQILLNPKLFRVPGPYYICEALRLVNALIFYEQKTFGFIDEYSIDALVIFYLCHLPKTFPKKIQV